MIEQLAQIKKQRQILETNKSSIPEQSYKQQLNLFLQKIHKFKHEYENIQKQKSIQYQSSQKDTQEKKDTILIQKQLPKCEKIQHEEIFQKIESNDIKKQIIVQENISELKYSKLIAFMVFFGVVFVLILFLNYVTINKHIQGQAEPLPKPVYGMRQLYQNLNDIVNYINKPKKKPQHIQYIKKCKSQRTCICFQLEKVNHFQQSCWGEKLI